MKNRLRSICKALPVRLAAVIAPAIIAMMLLQYFTASRGASLIVFISISLVYIGIMTVLFLARRSSGKHGTPDTHTGFTPDINTTLYNSVSSPICACDMYGLIRWGNKAFREISDSAGRNIRRFSEIAGIGIDQVKSTIDGSKECMITVAGKNYRIEGTVLGSDQDMLYITIWHDVSDLERVRQELSDNDALIAYIYIDNLEELAQIERDNYASATAAAERILFEWAASVNGVLISYERDKYVLFYKAKYLTAFIDSKFDILDKIREIRVGSGYLPITISIGTSNIGKNFSEKRDNAYSALKFALAKGGDQAMVKTEKFSYHFGGITKTSQKRSAVKSHTISRALSAQICRSSNVLIMGHRNPDFDCFGSCVGMARLCTYLGVECNIIIDKSSPNIEKCFPLLNGLDEYDNMFVTSTESLDLIRNDTTLIVCDVNNNSQFELPGLADRVGNVVYIDHHRQTEEFTTTPLLSYIEPSASSACELVSEILEQVSDSLLRPQEANLMYAGIVLDTKHFVINTGVRTFESARYLRSIGDPAETYDLFRTGLDEMAREARFEISKEPYRKTVMIALNDLDGNDEGDITIGAKISDRLLNVEGIEATFVILRLDGAFRISARSSGDINVETILRRLGGGGHFNAAGASWNESSSAHDLINALKRSIDIFLDEERGRLEAD